MNNNLEAILLAGGNGNRLKPFSHYTSKHLLPIDNVPMIFYPLKNLQLIGVKKVFLIINEIHKTQWDSLINAYDFNMEIIPIIQDRPLGIPAAIRCCEDKIKGDNFLVALGDNVIIASNFLNNFKHYVANKNKSTICGFNVPKPSAFGVAEFNDHGELIRVVEKPLNPPSNIAIGGFYCFPSNSFSIIRGLEFSDRGELEIADLINTYIDEGMCDLVLSKGQSDYWMDTGTNDSLVKATNFIRDLKTGSGLDIAQFQPKNV